MEQEDFRNVLKVSLIALFRYQKSQIAASSNDVLRDVRRKMGPISGQHGMVIEALGVDMAAGRSRRSFWKGSVSARRMRTLKKRRGRLARLRGACVGTARKVALVGVFACYSLWS